MPRYALINANGTINWSRDSDLAGVARTGPGSYILRFTNDCDQDVIVFHARTPGPNCDGFLVAVAALQDGANRICLSVGNIANFAAPHDAQISYIRYRKADEFGDGGGQTSTEGTCLPCADLETRGWYAWINLMPPGPEAFYVTGEVYVPNPGVELLLVPRTPQGINPEVLLLDLYVHQQPGVWPQVFVCKPARYERVPAGTRYTRVNVFCGDIMISDVPVEEVH